MWKPCSYILIKIKMNNKKKQIQGKTLVEASFLSPGDSAFHSEDARHSCFETRHHLWSLNEALKPREKHPSINLIAGFFPLGS